ncbi:MAG: ATP synthase F1 subunit gamma [Myxococcales bacterium]|nr:ATP synthase F1 subunit gamma [Myxococcales bacterium]
MPSLKAIRRRIVSVKNTQKITRAMKMVAAARLRRAQQRIVELRPYAEKTREVLQSVASKVGPEAHPLFQAREVKTVLLLVFTSDRGLAGGFNSSILRAVDRKIVELEEAGKAVEIAVLGRKGRDHFRRRNVTIRHDLVGAYEGGATRAAEIARTLMADFSAAEGGVDEVIAVFNEFKSAMTQLLRMQQVLPLVTPAAAEAEASAGNDYIYEPSREALLNTIVPMYVEVSVFRAMLESQASEHGARMTAMDNATGNAKKMIASLTLEYNRARQAAITKELMEIIGGSEALKD